MAKVYIGLGSNLGNREEQLLNAVQLLIENGSDFLECSSVYESEAFGFESETTFYNMVVLIETELSPMNLLGILKNIESALGRVKLKANEYESRTIDLDILFYDSEVINTIDLIIPHRHFADRKFVLVPMSELNPLLVNPLAKKTINWHLEKTSDLSEPIKVVTNTQFLKKLGAFSGVKKK